MDMQKITNDIRQAVHKLEGFAVTWKLHAMIDDDDPETSKCCATGTCENVSGPTSMIDSMQLAESNDVVGIPLDQFIVFAQVQNVA
jgi:hypothetical protein